MVPTASGGTVEVSAGRGYFKKKDFFMTAESVLLEQSMDAKGRSLLYRIIASLYLKEASADTLHILSMKDVAEALGGLGADMGKFSAPMDDMGLKRLLDELAEEYAALFILPGGVSPYESVRLKGLLCQGPEWQVREFYEKFGVKMRKDSNIFCDHIGMEFDFMSYLSGKESAALSAKDEADASRWQAAQREFFSGHINKLAQGFLDELDKCAFHPFYKEVSSLTRKFIQMEGEELLELEPADGQPEEAFPV